MAILAAEREEKRRGISSRAAAGLSVWGNWYILRTSHDFGWPSHYSCLSYYGLFSAGHKVLFDTPAHVRLVDVAVGQLPELLRHALVLRYWWHRKLNGNEIEDSERYKVLGLDSASQYREVLRTAKLCAEKEIETLDRRRENATIPQSP